MARCVLVQSDGRYYVQRDDAQYSDPIAVRQWWPVDAVRYGNNVGPRGEFPLGEELRSLHQHQPGQAQYSVGWWNIYLPDGGRTLACRKWEAPIPAPKGAHVITESWRGVRGDCFYKSGQWVRIMAGYREKPVLINWDKLKWKEVDTGR